MALLKYLSFDTNFDSVYPQSKIVKKHENDKSLIVS